MAMEISEQLASLWGVRRELSQQDDLCIDSHIVEETERCGGGKAAEEESYSSCCGGLDEEMPTPAAEPCTPAELSHTLAAPLSVETDGRGEFPVHYQLPPGSLRQHEFVAVGLYVDPRIVPGFKYRVRPIRSPEVSGGKERWLWDGEAVALQSIGRGYSRRLTFAPAVGQLNDNPRYFWPDSSQLGYALDQEVLSIGDKFTVFDASQLPVATLEVLQLQGRQEEVGMRLLTSGEIEKTSRVKCLAKVEWFHSDQAQPTNRVPMSGLAVSVKSKNGKISTKVVSTTIGSGPRKGYTLRPGVDHSLRSTVVRGTTIADVPTSYTVFGLEPHELPVIGTYVDPRIVTGFYYRVRTAGSRRRPLFKSESEPRGLALELVSIGRGYGKRLVFGGGVGSLNDPQAYLWSDSHLDGLGFEISAVRAGMTFAVFAGEMRLGSARVFRADAPQIEKAQALTDEGLVKEVHVELTCTLSLDELPDSHTHTMRVSGTAVLLKSKRSSSAQLLHVQDIGLESQLNVLFTMRSEELVFRPI